ncbi:HK97 family phage prohead protease [Pseudoxanthobacter sp. M-2]|uniref:prohead protease/major capsid protein fusion protein n=1 Tax=Pseudoxanthobacter sp. M-2 TaxID=3078754 RepID=UPI0038FC6131
MNAPATTTAPAEILTRLATASPRSWNAETMTFEAVLSSGAAVRRYDFAGEFDEIIQLSQTWPATVPLLDSHQRESVDRRLGSVDSLVTVGGQLRGRATLSRHNPLSQRIAAELSDGQTYAFSIGYIVLAHTERTNPRTKRREKIATQIDLVEVSLVIVPADRLTGIRNAEMTDSTASATEPSTNPPPAPPAPAANTVQTTDRAAVNAEIRSIATVAGLDQSWIDQRIDAGDTAERASVAAVEALRSRTPPAPIRNTVVEVGVDHTDPAFRARTIGEALYVRHTPGVTPSDAAKPYVHMTTLDIARDCLRVRSIATTGLSPTATIERALHTTSDFPLLLGDLVNRTLRATYMAVPSALKQIARQSNARDFRAKHRLQISEGPRLEKVNEAGEFRSGTLVEAKESYAVATYGKIIPISRQALVNDDLGAFTDLSRRLGQAAAATEAQLLADLFAANAGAGPTMSDGQPLFHTTHKNVATVLGTPWKGETPPAFAPLIAAGRLAMRKQVGLSGELIAVTPRYLIVPSAGETDAEKALAAFTPTRAEDVNPFSNLVLVVEPRLADDDAWMIAADPAAIDGLEWAYLEGVEGPQVESKAGFEVDGVQVRVRLDFGAGFVDWRGWFRNAGT